MWEALNAVGRHLISIERVRDVFSDEVISKPSHEGYGRVPQTSGGWGVCIVRGWGREIPVWGTQVGGSWYPSLFILAQLIIVSKWVISYKMFFPTLTTWQTPKHSESSNSNTTSLCPLFWCPRPGRLGVPSAELLSCNVDGTCAPLACEVPKDKDYTCLVCSNSPNTSQNIWHTESF